ncbi:MAG: hypothetical protein FWH48_10920 [Oscillospiraceae bacterium]|nr:hypothetical protein [Oscillospiraceae bacterium]
MSLFDKIKNQTTGAVGKAVANAATPTKGSNKSVPVVFSTMPETLSEFKALPQAEMKTPFETAAMLVAALCVYPLNKDESIAMINYLKGPNPLSNRELQFIADRMSQNNKAGFIGASYFNGATPQNDYTPSQPYTVTVSENPYSYDNQGYANLYIKSGGADSARPVNLRQAKDGKWYLWEQLLLADIRQPESTNPWA